MSDLSPAAEPGTSPVDASETSSPNTTAKRPMRLTTILIVAALVIASAGAVYAANYRWGTHAMVTTALSGAEALVKGDGTALARLSVDPMRSQLTPDLVAKMQKAAMKVDFTTVKWKGENVSVGAQTGLGVGILLVGPSDAAADQAVFRTLGALGDTVGVISLKRTWSGWAITAMTAGLATETTGSTAPTSTPSGSGAATATP